MAARYVLRSGRQPRCGVVFAANTCEEGLGNLKGSRALLDALGEDVCQVVSFDLGLDTVFTGRGGLGPVSHLPGDGRGPLVFRFRKAQCHCPNGGADLCALPPARRAGGDV